MKSLASNWDRPEGRCGNDESYKKIQVDSIWRIPRNNLWACDRQGGVASFGNIFKKHKYLHKNIFKKHKSVQSAHAISKQSSLFSMIWSVGSENFITINLYKKFLNGRANPQHNPPNYAKL